MNTSYDLLIIGGGPSGLACALESIDSNLSHLVLEKSERLGGQLFEIPVPIPNVPGFNSYSDGSQLAKAMQSEADVIGCNIAYSQEIKSLELNQNCLTIATPERTYDARSIFIATGARYRSPQFKRQENFKDYVLYRHNAPDHHFINKEVVIAGGGDSALYAAMNIVEIAKSITVIYRNDKMRARPDLIEELERDRRIKTIANSEIIELFGSNKLEAVKVWNRNTKKEQVIDTDVVYTKFGYQPNSELFVGQLKLTETGHIKVSTELETSVPGVFAGGDVASPGFDRIAVAMGHGVLAARSVRKYLGLLS